MHQDRDAGQRPRVAFDAVIRNAGIGYRERRRIETADGLPQVFATNTLGAPYILTALIRKPERLVYLSSGKHRSGDPSLKDLLWRERPARQRMPTPSCTTQSSRSRSRAGGPTSSPMRWNPDGCRLGWAARVRRTTSKRGPCLCTKPRGDPARRQTTLYLVTTLFVTNLIPDVVGKPIEIAVELC
jgi:hypothetical protein